MGGGVSAKSIGIDQFFDYLKTQAADTDINAAYSAVVWQYRCVQLRANALSSIPYRIMQGDTEVEWDIPLSRRLWEIEADLLLYAAAYWLRQKNRVRLVNLQRLNPSTMQVKVKGAQIVAFEQTIGGQRVVFDPEDIIYFRLWSPKDDLGPGVAPAQVALEAAGLGRAANQWAANFFKQGAIPAVILTTDQPIPAPEVERVETAWDRLYSGVKRAFKTAVLRYGLTPHVVGQPVKDLGMPSLLASVRQQIAVANGVPITLLEDAANYATARQHSVSFWRETVMPEAKLVAEVLNEHLFKPMGLEFVFDFSQIEALQQDEASKAQAVVQLVTVGIMTRSEARQQMGLPEEEPVEPADMTEKQPPPEAKSALKGMFLTDLRRFRRKANKKGGPVGFTSDYIPESMIKAIQGAIQELGPTAAFRFMKAAPDGRDEAERRLRQAAGEALTGQLPLFAAAVRAGETPDYEVLSAALVAALLNPLAEIATEIMLRESLTVGVGFDYALINEAAMRWARDYTYSLVSGLTDRTRKVVSGAIEQFVSTPGMTREEVEALLRPAFGDVRAEMIGVTETTRAYSAATNEYQGMLAEAGLDMERVWNTRNDELVCPICGPLNGQPESVWVAQLPDGAPAHVNCRCWITLRVKA